MFEAALTPEENLRLECLQQAVLVDQTGNARLVIEASEKFAKYVKGEHTHVRIQNDPQQGRSI